MYNLETLLGERVLEVFMCVRIMGWLRNTSLACSMDDGLTVTVGAGCEIGAWRRGWKRGAGRSRIPEEDLALALSSLHLVVSGGEPKANLRPYSLPRVWYIPLGDICSMWLQPSSMYLTSMRRMCSGAQQTLAGSLAIPMSPMGPWPMEPPVFW